MMLYGPYSSGFTGAYKYLLPPVWIGVFGWVTRQMFVHPESVSFLGVRGGAPPGTEWLFLAGWIAGSVVVVWLAWRLAWIRIADGRMYIRKFRREVALDFRWLRSVSELKRVRPRLVRIAYMDADGRDKIAWFMPAVDLQSDTPAEPQLVAELQRIIRESRVSAA